MNGNVLYLLKPAECLLPSGLGIFLLSLLPPLHFICLKATYLHETSIKLCFIWAQIEAPGFLGCVPALRAESCGCGHDLPLLYFNLLPCSPLINLPLITQPGRDVRSHRAEIQSEVARGCFRLVEQEFFLLLPLPEWGDAGFTGFAAALP